MLIIITALLFLATAGQADVTGRIHVVDGDTLRVGETVVRLHGIDAPELDQTCRDANGQNWACGAWVRDQMRAMYQRKRTRCSAVDTDRYGRMVARCQVRGQDIGQRMVREGLAFAYRRYSMAYDLDEKRAAVNKVGLHASAVQSPSDFRRAKAQANQQPAPGRCKIKGNISSKGTRIFHVPGQEHYGRTRINTSKGERWFCSAQEARAAGWRAARR